MAYKPNGTKTKHDVLLKKLVAEQSKKKVQAIEVAKSQGLLRRSPRLKLLGGEKKKQEKPKKTKPFEWEKATKEEMAERVICDYNKTHGTKLEFVGLLADRSFVGCGFSPDLVIAYSYWRHFNIEARDPESDNKQPLVLFAELKKYRTEYNLITLEPTTTTTTDGGGCFRCSSCVSHPRHGFRAAAGCEEPNSKKSLLLSQQAAAELSKFALHAYNNKHGTSIKLERALNGNSFTCSGGLSMDLKEKKNTNWVHMNFEARLKDTSVVCLFAELYLEGDDDGEYVLAKLSPAAPVAHRGHGAAGVWRKEEYTGVNGCAFCPPNIHHPWHPCRS